MLASFRFAFENLRNLHQLPIGGFTEGPIFRVFAEFEHYGPNLPFCLFELAAKSGDFGIGAHAGLKIPWTARPVWVRFPPPALLESTT